MALPSPESVRLHVDLYSENGVHEAARTFADFATFAIRTEGDHYVIDVTDISRDVSGYVVAEFCNFALANSITRGRQ